MALDVVKRFTLAYAGGDSKTVDSLATDRAFVRRFEDVAKARCLRLERFEVTSFEQAGTKARAEVALSFFKGSRSGDFEQRLVQHLRLELAQQGARWRVRSVGLAETDLARALIAASSAEERACLLQQHPDLVNLDLGRAVYEAAIALTNLGRNIDGSRVAQIALDIAQLTGDRGGEILARGIDTIHWREDGRVQQAVALSRELVAAAVDAGDRDVLARAFVNLSRAHQREGADAEALAMSERVIAMEHELEDRRLVVRALLNSATIYRDRADFRIYRSFISRSIALAHEIGDVTGEAFGEAALGSSYLPDDCAEARRHVERAERFGAGPYLTFTSSNTIAICYAVEGDFARANATIKRMKDLAGEIKNFTVDDVLETAASVHEKEGRYDLALREARIGAERRRARGEVSEILPQVLLRVGRYREALAVMQPDLKALRAGERDLFVLFRTLAGRAHRALNEPDEALAALREAVEVSESIRPLLGGNESQEVAMFESVADCYRESADLLVERGQNAEALRVAELQKSRTLLRLIKTGRPALSSMLTARDRDSESSLRRAIVNLNKEVEMLQDEGRAENEIKLHRRLEAAQAAYEEFRADLYARNPRLRTAEGDIRMPADETLAKVLPPDTAFVEFVTAADALVVMVVRSDGRSLRTTGHRVPLTQSDLVQKIDRWVRELAALDLGYRSSAKNLYSLLIEPIADELTEVKKICFVPDGALWRIPFEALIDAGGRHLVERFEVSYAPSLTVYASMAGRAAGGRNAAPLLAVGNPRPGDRTRKEVEALYRGLSLGPLPDAEREVEALAALYGTGSRVYKGREASENVVKDVAPKAPILHFATHAVLDNTHPMFSRILLAADPSGREDGLLEAWEIMDLRLDADLVVLSACDTARGKIGAGGGVVGMAWAFFAAGARAVVASQWNVSSAKSADLMVAFHRALRGGKQTPSAALRSAKMALMKSESSAHPFYWAPFVLVGSSR